LQTAPGYILGMNAPDTSALLRDAAARAARYLETIGARSVAPSAEAVAALDALDVPLSEGPTPGADLLADLDAQVGPATMAMAGPRFFGFVIGGALPASVAASFLATAWDQNSARSGVTPGTSRVEAVALRWLLEALHLPPDTAGGFVTGGTLANFTCLAAARHALLARAGWDVEERGLFGAPEIRVVVGAEAHVSVLKALALLGLGKARAAVVPVDGQGRLRAEALPPLDARTILCLQAGNVNTGSFDPAEAIVPRARAGGAWVHVDGAFGLWARAAPGRAALARGLEEADSWATDLHKMLNVPYDSGLALVRDGEALRAAMGMTAAYLPKGQSRDPADYTPELSRRARGVEAWAALRALGRRGIAELVERCCRHARRFAEGLAAAGHRVLNEVVLNQVLVSFGDAERTRRVVAAIQRDGTCWCGGTVWQGQEAMRISVCSWATTDADVEASLEAMIRAARVTP
jgi:glutamate/tyrosine decarboxylase-like PLP-dependent enzyme